MGVVGFAAQFNRRREAGLCATVICVGLILLLGGGVSVAVGISLLGTAFSWALGSNNKVVHWLFVVLGLLLPLAAVPDWYGWPKTKAELIESKTLVIELDKNLIQSDTSLKDHERLSRDQQALARDQQEMRSLQTEGVLRHVIKTDWGILAGSLLLLIAGLGLIVGVKPAAKSA